MDKTKGISITNDGIFIDGKREFLLTGEFPYYRMSPEKWSERLDMVKESGIRVITCYVPWNFHEFNDNSFDFDGKSGTDRRNIRYFLKLLQERDMYAICKPGPFICAELKHGGIPDWLTEKYPEIVTRDCHRQIVGFRQDNKPLPEYFHPTYLYHVKRWYKAFYDQVLHDNSVPEGCVAMLQVENEIPYSTSGLSNPYSWGYNPCMFEIYSKWLKDTYKTIQEYNEVHGTQYVDFDEITPPVDRDEDSDKVGSYGLMDWVVFKEWYGAEILDLYGNYFKEAGAKIPLYHNFLMLDNESPANYYKMAEKMWVGVNFWIFPYPNKDFNSYVQGHLRTGYLKASQPGLPAYAPELNWGWGKSEDFDFLTRYLLPDLEGLNIYTVVNTDEAGEYNDERYSNEGELFPSSAPIGVDGSTGDAFNAMKIFTGFIEEYGSRLVESRNLSKIGIGFYVPYNYAGVYQKDAGKYNTPQKLLDEFTGRTKDLNTVVLEIMKGFTKENIDYAMADIGNIGIDSRFDIVFIPAMPFMDEVTQTRILEFISNGGNVVLIGDFPSKDLYGRKCCVLENEMIPQKKFKLHGTSAFTCGKGKLIKLEMNSFNKFTFEEIIEFLGGWAKYAYAEEENIQVIPRYTAEEVFLYVINRGANEFNGNVYYRNRSGDNFSKLYSSAAPASVTIIVIKDNTALTILK